MEVPQRQGVSNKQQRNNTLSAGGGAAPIAGLLLLGGAFAVTGLFAVASFVTTRTKTKASTITQSHHASQDSSANHHDIHNTCHETSNMTEDQVLSCESLPRQTSILILAQEDKPDLKVGACIEEERATSQHQEIVLSDDSPPESTVSFNDHETMESSADSPCFEEVDQSEPQQPLKSVEINEGKHDNDSATTETEDDIVEEDDDVGFETSENNSEATGKTSLDSGEAPIWPAELIEQEPQQVKGEMVNDQIEAEGTAESNMSCTYVQSHSGANLSEFSGYAGNDRVMGSAKANSSDKPTLYTARNYRPSLTKFKTSATLLLLLFAIMLLVLVNHRNRISGTSTVAIL